VDRKKRGNSVVQNEAQHLTLVSPQRFSSIQDHTDVKDAPKTAFGAHVSNKIITIVPSDEKNMASLDGKEVAFALSSRDFPAFEHPSHELLRADGFIQHKYFKYFINCMQGTHYITAMRLTAQNVSVLVQASHPKSTRCIASGLCFCANTSITQCTRNSSGWL
jgi:hypothetical protein